MKYDVIIVGAGPGGIFAAYELVQKKPELKVGIFESGHSLSKRKCPIDGEKIKTCINCKTCSIMSGFGGAGAFSVHTRNADALGKARHQIAQIIRAGNEGQPSPLSLHVFGMILGDRHGVDHRAKAVQMRRAGRIMHRNTRRLQLTRHLTSRAVIARCTNTAPGREHSQ